MEQTFKKTIKGHLLQFNRLHYPLRYSVKLDDEGSAGEQIFVKKENGKEWEITGVLKLRIWVQELSSDIIAEIEKNESSES